MSTEAPFTPIGERFVLPLPCDDQTPMVDLHVYQWCKTVPRRDADVPAYLQAQGFVLGQHRVTEKEYSILKNAIDYFHHTAPHFPGVLSFNECFTPCADARDPAGFYVVGHPGRYMLNTQLKEALQGAGWIYDVEPGTTYFQIFGKTLRAKYQHIIGGRALVQLSDVE